jgi:hypothetical protein
MGILAQGFVPMAFPLKHEIKYGNITEFIRNDGI